MDQAEIERNIRMEKIFMPQAMRQREAAFDRQKNAETKNPPDFIRFAHYTTADAAMSILRTKRLWMRNATCMTDYREVRHGFDILQKYFTPDRTKEFALALDTSVPGAAMRAINDFNTWWQNNLPLNIFVASVSEHQEKEDAHGRLSMWRAFGANSARVAIVFRIPRFTGSAGELSILFSPVAYLTEAEVHNVIRQVLASVSTESAFLKGSDPKVVQSYVFFMLLAGVSCLKHEGFGEELEWRAIHAPQIWSSPLMKADIETVRGVPQHIYKLPLDGAASSTIADLDIAKLVDRVIIGPSPYPWVTYHAFVDELTKAGVMDAGVKVFTSGIPIRS